MNELSDVVWSDILGYVRTQHRPIARAWFGQLQAGTLEQGRLTIRVANEAQLSYLREHCVRPFIEGAQAATGHLVTVEFSVSPELDVEPVGTQQASPEPPRFEGESVLLHLNPDYVFENFVVGPCNRLAHASCVAVSESPGAVYNPLFIHGSAGLGKTHLLQAICQKVLDRSPSTRVTYMSCETFVNHFIEAVEKGALHGFRYRYRHVDLLIVDDIQFLAARERTQEEFFHTFNTLYQLHKQIVLSADCRPSEIPTLEERLTSRFNWGLVAAIDPPCLETRMAIIRKKMKMRDMDLPEDVVMLLASRIKSNTRELEGALSRLRGIAALEGNRPVDIALARRALGHDDQGSPRHIHIQEIMSVVTERFGVKLSDLQGRRRSRSIALPRQVCMYLARELTGHSLNEIGGFFGGRDHTTVLHAHKLVEQRREQDVSFRSRLEQIEAALRQS
ncbi:MAG TPA: chromosomal replication initiator protein DnaA [Phycisphaerae bacterium]|nr:chromosomal replication initiator protein DnaA [Phycisphaerae bacterium]